jgi:hypothetical protein
MKGTVKKERPTIPRIILIDGKVEHQGVIGSHCWDGICVDYTKPSDRVDYPEKVFIQKDANITFKVLNNIDPDQLHVTIFSGDKIMLHRTIDKQMKMRVPKGTYFLNVKATWKEKGDVSNVFSVEVL